MDEVPFRISKKRETPYQGKRPSKNTPSKNPSISLRAIRSLKPEEDEILIFLVVRSDFH